MALAFAERGERAMLCAVVGSRGSTPQSAGSLMLLDEAMRLHGTVGGGCVEAEVRRLAAGLLEAGASRLLRFRLDHDYGWDDGLICGGTVEIAVVPAPNATRLREVLDAIARREPAELRFDVQSDDGARSFVLLLPPRERLLIAGAGHVGQAVARLALPLEFDITLYDDRIDCLERFAPPGAATVSGDIADRLREAPVDSATYAIVVTRGHRHDEAALEALLGRGARYLGMIGSRRKVKLIHDDLRERGARPEDLAAVHAPIGLPIGGVTVEEIALSIVAQLVQVRRSVSAPRVREIAPEIPASVCGVAGSGPVDLREAARP